jgi:hypothetical protein
MKKAKLDSPLLILFLESCLEHLAVETSTPHVLKLACESVVMNQSSLYFKKLLNYMKLSQNTGLSESEYLMHLKLKCDDPKLNRVFSLFLTQSREGSLLRSHLESQINQIIEQHYEALEAAIEKLSVTLLLPLFGSGFISTLLFLSAAIICVMGET